MRQFSALKVKSSLPDEPGLLLLQLKGCTGKALRVPPRSAFAVLPPTSDAPPSSAGVVHQDYAKTSSQELSHGGRSFHGRHSLICHPRGSLAAGHRWSSCCLCGCTCRSPAPHRCPQISAGRTRCSCGADGDIGQEFAGELSAHPSLLRRLLRTIRPAVPPSHGLLRARTCMDTHFSQPVIHRWMGFPGHHLV